MNDPSYEMACTYGTPPWEDTVRYELAMYERSLGELVDKREVERPEVIDLMVKGGSLPTNARAVIDALPCGFGVTFKSCEIVFHIERIA